MSSLERPYAFFLGGRDLEMVAIRELVETSPGNAVHDKGLAWGARASDYEAEIRESLRRDQIPVLVELERDLDLPASAIVIDHHNERSGSGAKTALEQVFDLLDLPAERWTRRLALIDANDRGHVDELVELGASEEELQAIRAEDRAAQGITGEEDEAAREAIRGRRVGAGGRLTIVELPHAKSSAVVDQLDSRLGGPGYQNLLVISPAEVNFYGDGQWVEVVQERYGGWVGGRLPDRGYWGSTEAHPDIEDFLLKSLAGEP